MSATVLVLCNDFSLAAAKTSRHLGQAITRLGGTAVVRDTRILRWALAETEKEFPARRDAYEDLVHGKWFKFAVDYGFDTIISLDLHWLFTSKLFVDSEPIRGIHSFWFDDLRSHLKTSAMFPLAPLELINRPKVSHHCYGQGQMEELRLLGVQRVLPSKLAAPSEYLESHAPCTVRDRIASSAIPAWPRRRRRGRSRRSRKAKISQQCAGSPGRNSSMKSARASRRCRGCANARKFADLLAAATELRLAQPYTAAIALLVEAGKTYPQAFDFSTAAA